MICWRKPYICSAVRRGLLEMISLVAVAAPRKRRYNGEYGGP